MEADITCMCSAPFAYARECGSKRGLKTPCRCACHRPKNRELHAAREYAARLESALGGRIDGAGELPGERTFFTIIGDDLLYRPGGSATRDFGGRIGLCFEARRTKESGLAAMYEGNAGVWPVGEREWVRVAQVVKVLPGETEAFYFLHPELRPALAVLPILGGA